MADGYTTMYDILKNSLVERRERYGTTAISHIVIDGNKFGGYKTFSSFWEKTYVKQPERSASGVIDNLNSYATFVTFHLKVDFAMMSIDDYRRLYNLMISKNEFIVTAYNVLDNSTHTCKMYFAPDQMPKLYAVARKLQGTEDKFIEVLGVQDYTIELIGTNADMDLVSIIYYDGNGNKIGSADKYLNVEFLVGEGISVPSLNGRPFSGQWKRESTNTYFNNKTAIELQFEDNTSEEATKTVSFIAQYANQAEYTLSLSWGVGTPLKDKNGNDITIIKFQTGDSLQRAISRNAIELQTGGKLTYLQKSPNPTIIENGQEYETYISPYWRKGATTDYSVVTNATPLNMEANIIFYQVFQPVKHTVTFDSNGGTTYNQLTSVEYNSTVALPTPYKAGKTFKGWYKDSGFKTSFNGKMPPYDITLYAKWE